MKYLIGNIKIVGAETGEVFSTQDFNYKKMSDEELTDLLVVTKRFANDVRNEVSLMETEFLMRMGKKKATKYETNQYKISIQQKNEYEYDTKLIEELRCMVTEEQFNQTFTPLFGVNRTALKSLMGFGGKIKKLINKLSIVKPQKPYLKIEMKGEN